MAFWYNMTIVDASNILTFIQTTNDSFVQSQLGHLILLSIFFISLISFSFTERDVKYNLVVSMFAVAIFSILFRILQLVPDMTPFVCGALYAILQTAYIFSPRR